jgi:hypothetical protein
LQDKSESYNCVTQFAVFVITPVNVYGCGSRLR